jgi:hypothetical protein
MATRVLSVETERPYVTLIVLIIIAVLLIGGLWYVRGRRA